MLYRVFKRLFPVYPVDKKMDAESVITIIKNGVLANVESTEEEVIYTLEDPVVIGDIFVLPLHLDASNIPLVWVGPKGTEPKSGSVVVLWGDVAREGTLYGKSRFTIPLL